MRVVSLTLVTILAAVAGAFIGQYLLFDPQIPVSRGHWTFVVGDLILFRPLMLIAPPLAFLGVLNAARSMRASSRFGLAIGSAVVWFAVSMVAAAIIAVVAAVVLRPGELSADSRTSLVESATSRFESTPDVSRAVTEIVSSQQDSLAGAWLAFVRRALPRDPLGELESGRWLGVLVLALVMGLALATGRGQRESAVHLLDVLERALLSIARWIGWIAPLGILLLTANAVGSVGIEGMRGSTEPLVLTVLAALGAHALVILPLALVVFGRINPLFFFLRSLRVLLAAMATSSSVATLPLAMEVATVPSTRREQPRRSTACSRASASLVLPLGAMLNLNGTAIFQAVAVVFLCQVQGIELHLVEMVVIVITATIAAISAVGLPSAGLITLIIVITGVNTSLAGRGHEPLPASSVGMLIAIDRILDMFRTAVNVWGNLVAARVISVIAPDDPSESLRELPGPD